MFSNNNINTNLLVYNKFEIKGQVELVNDVWLWIHFLALCIAYGGKIKPYKNWNSIKGIKMHYAYTDSPALLIHTDSLQWFIIDAFRVE